MDKFPKVIIEPREALQITCHRCHYTWNSVSAVSHVMVICPQCRTNVTVRPVRPTGPRTPSPVGIFTTNEQIGRIKTIKYSNVDPHTGESKLLAEQNFPLTNDDEYTSRNNSRRKRNANAATASKSKSKHE